MDKRKYFYINAHNSNYFQSTSESIYEVDLIKDLVADILFHHASFHGFCQSYNYRHGIKFLSRDRLNVIRLADIFYTFHLVQYHCEFLNSTLIRKISFGRF